MDIQEKYLAWLQCPAMPAFLQDQLRAMTEEEKSDAFYRDLAFGTGGLRGVLGAGTNRMNYFTVQKATRGLGAYLLSSFEHPSCAISCDSRILSREFAELAAAVLAEMGISVWLYPELEPTPMLSYAVRHQKASAGVMITASHNPAKFNGYKVYGSDGCQITLDAAEKIQTCISRQPDLVSSFPSFDRYLTEGVIRYIPQDLIEDYYQYIFGLRVAPLSQPLNVVYSPLNGAGNIPVREVLRRMGNVHVDVVREQEMPDGHFPSCPYPNPEIREAMQLAIQKTIDTHADFCFATDPDCDRMGAGIRVGNEVRLISGNDMGMLMLDYLCRHVSRRGDKPPVVVKTIVSTGMAVPICRKYGLELREVLTGFKYIGEQIGLLEAAGEESRFLLGFEESFGYLSGTGVRDKDAVNAAVLLCDLAAELKSQGKTLLDRLSELREEFGLYEQRLLTYEYEGENGAVRMNRIMASLRAPSDSFTDPELRSAVRTDYLHDQTGLPKSDVLSFRLSERDQFIVRPSGTEPKLKAYLFTRAGTTGQAAEQLDHLQRKVDLLCR